MSGDSGSWLQWLLKQMSNNGQYHPGQEYGNPYSLGYGGGATGGNGGYPGYAGYYSSPRSGGNGGDPNAILPPLPPPHILATQPQTIFGFSPFMFLLILLLIVVALAIRILYNIQHRQVEIEKHLRRKVGFREMQDYVGTVIETGDYDAQPEQTDHRFFNEVENEASEDDENEDEGGQNNGNGYSRNVGQNNGYSRNVGGQNGYSRNVGANNTSYSQNNGYNVNTHRVASKRAPRRQADASQSYGYSQKTNQRENDDDDYVDFGGKW
jgi:hypothetical protein